MTRMRKLPTTDDKQQPKTKKNLFKPLPNSSNRFIPRHLTTELDRVSIVNINNYKKVSFKIY